MCRSQTWRLACRKDSVPLGRHRVADALAQWGAADSDPARAVVDDILLVATELLSNGAKACHGLLLLTVSVHRGAVSVVVADDDPAPARPLDPCPSESSGRGLQLVRRLGTAWGQTAWDGTSKQVWCEVMVPVESALGAGCVR